MIENSCSEINLHIIWQTRTNLPLIKSGIESRLYAVLKHKIVITGGVRLHALGGT